MDADTTAGTGATLPDAGDSAIALELPEAEAAPLTDDAGSGVAVEEVEGANGVMEREDGAPLERPDGGEGFKELRSKLRGGLGARLGTSTALVTIPSLASGACDGGAGAACDGDERGAGAACDGDERGAGAAFEGAGAAFDGDEGGGEGPTLGADTTGAAETLGGFGVSAGRGAEDSLVDAASAASSAPARASFRARKSLPACSAAAAPRWIQRTASRI
jgi:hypothetical protein